jgi:hypothetical protein
MDETVKSVFVLLIPLVGVILIGTWLAVLGLVRERRKEREALYRYETARKLVDRGELDFAQFEAFIEGEHWRAFQGRREGLKLAGWLLLFGGGMLTGGIAAMSTRTPDWRQFLVISTIPEVLGAGLLLYVYLLGPRAPKRPAG